MKHSLGLHHRFFCFLAWLCIRLHSPTVVGITGSIGKTTARHFLAHIFRSAGISYYTPAGNYNGEWGLALSVLQIRSGGETRGGWLVSFLGALRTLMMPGYPQYLILEYGVDHIGEMDIQIDIVEPDIALFTTLSPSHIAGFGTVEAYYAEKHKLLRRSSKNTYAIGNADDRNQKGFDCQSWYTTTLNDNADLSIDSISSFVDRIEMDFCLPDRRHHVVTPIVDTHLMGILAGVSLVAQRIGITEENIVSSLSTLDLPYGRGNTLSGIDDAFIIDGTYNGGFEPIVAGVRSLIHRAGLDHRRSIALIGDMRELGPLETPRHHELWNQLMSLSVDYYVFVGPVCLSVIRPMMSESWAEKTFFTLDSRVAGDHIYSMVTESTDKYLIFAKGSQNTIYLEEALKYFVASSEMSKLVRQSDFYMKKKQVFFETLH